MGIDMTKIGLGSLLLLASTVILLATGGIDSNIPLALAAVAAVGLAAGSLLIGTSEDGRPV